MLAAPARIARSRSEIGLSVREALAAVTEWKPDVLVSDIGMARRSGSDLIGIEVPRSAERRRIPAIALTGYAAAARRVSARLSAGYQMPLGKPIEPNHLCQSSQVSAARTVRRPRVSASRLDSSFV